MRPRRLLQNLDYLVPITVLILIASGILIINSATQDYSFLNNRFVIKQLIATILGIIFLIISLGFDYSILRDYSDVIYVGSIILLISVLIFGTEISGSKSWLQLGPVNFQPSELVKLGLIISLSDFLAKRRKKLTELKHFIFACLYFLPFMLLVLLQNDLGTALVMLSIFAGVFYIAGANAKYYFSIVGVAFLSVAGMLIAHFQFGVPIPLKEYQLMRLIIFWNPKLDPLGYGYNIIQSKIAVGSGGLLGKGLFDGTQTQLGFLPEKHTDFIFSVLGEELGFLGASVILICYFVLLWRAIKIALDARDDFGQLIVVGVISMFLFHIFENIGMVIGIMPITGIPLPFVSYGGSSLLTNILAISLIINVNVRKQKLLF
ncbi:MULTISPECIES: rod shape-determining protein RodA [unclassified Candidatus Frackibacter]|uniref:rod shape-determining protein RodA n=1 Tax=unclassified Candidatus Frackibacter TaxID=2648818 RepID=UPI000880F18E|nr:MULTISPECIES: rod shape-determining protein RodA [unclassified Candidatus Frackibacter]SDC40500.1 rod shape determining protein RodA [Candidatus Frackibacter sp. WG11]SEM60302.1 rod shape determining protein RodA [Candidatus Frackibacter sp. WG12]SFL61683.1 rod shape determining protein RodA [Candidatus Frackibacter sp. WG13]